MSVGSDGEQGSHADETHAGGHIARYYTSRLDRRPSAGTPRKVQGHHDRVAPSVQCNLDGREEIESPTLPNSCWSPGCDKFIDVDDKDLRHFFG